MTCLGKYKQFEWDAKTDNNLIVAIFQRHLSSRLSPSEVVVEEMGKYFSSLMDNWDLAYEPEVPYVKEWVQSKNWSVAKKLKYY